MKNFTLLFVLIGFLSSPIYSQINSDSVFAAGVFKNVPYIFEGEVVSSKAFWNEDSNFIYTSNIIQITKIFRGGDLKCGTVELITKGGEIGTKAIEASHNLTYSEGNKGIFFAKPKLDSYPSLTESGETSNELILMNYSYLAYFGYDDVIPERVYIWGLGMTFWSYESLYKRLAQEENIERNDCPQPIIKDKDKGSVEHPECEIKEAVLKIYPNPASSILKIELALPKATKADIAIYDVQGKKVKSVANQEFTTGIHALEISIENLKKGQYLIRVSGIQVELSQSFIAN